MPTWTLWLGTGLLFLTGFNVLALSWGKWPDLLVDFGRELYIPWQLSQGNVLYQDIHFYYGPFSKYFYALLFRVFSPSLLLVFITNALILALLAVLLYRTLRAFATRGASWAALGIFFSLFAFGQYTGIANYNYMAPYSHELVHGLFLSCLALYLFSRALKRPSWGYTFLIGVTTGMALLTKVEAAMALAGTLAAGCLLTARVGGKAYWPRHGGMFFIGLLIPVLLFWIFFSVKMGPVQAWGVLLGPYAEVFNPGSVKNPLFQELSGWALPGKNVWLMGKAAGGYGIVAVCVVFLAWLAGRSRKRWIGWGTGIGIVLAWAWACWMFFENYLPPFEVFRPLFPVSLLALAFVGRQAFRSTAAPKEAKNIPRFMFALFGVLMLLKIPVYGHIFHYGFALAMPAVLFLVVAILDGGAVLCGRIRARPVIFYALVMMVFMAVVLNYRNMSAYYFALKHYPVAGGADRFLSYDPRFSPREPGMAQALAFMQGLPEGTSVAVLPEGVMLNYLARRTNPTPYFEFTPNFFDMVTEARVLSAFQSTPPEVIVLLDRDMSEYGARYFGKDYARSLFGWIVQNYDVVFRTGAAPFSGQGFWAVGMRRKGKS